MSADILWNFLREGASLFRRTKLAWSLLIVFLTSTNAFANLIDSIEIARVDDKAQVTVRFTTEIQYLRHAPDDEGKFLRVFFRISKPGFTENEVMQETMRSPSSALLPRFTLTYPELVNGMLITFAKATRFSVSPGGDARSILIFVPLSPEQMAKVPVAVPDKPAVVEPPPAAPKSVTPAPVTSLASDKKKGKSVTAKIAPVTVSVPPPVVPVVAAPPVDVANSKAPVQTPDAEKPDALAPLSSEKVEDLSRGFLVEAREAFEKADYVKAINRLSRVLGLPASSQTEGAQALMGEAREKNGEIAKARAEYELYLKLFPNGSEAPRLKLRLASLPSADQLRRSGARRPVRDDKPAEWTVFGSVSSYFFTGRSQQDAGSAKRDQESLVTSINLNARLRDSVTDTRFVFRDTDSRNFLNTQRNYNRIYSAYAERTDREVGYFVRAGRQNPGGGGVLERFDGLTGSYNLGSDWKVSGVVGNAVEFNSPYKKKFYGGSVELLSQLARPGASVYVIQQDIDGYLNRRAVGSELRYFDGQFSGYGMVDYDVLYKGLNILTSQGNYLDTWGNNYFVSYDYRKSPSYSLTSALGTTGFTSINDMVTQVGMTQTRTLVTDNTAASSMFAAGVTIPVGERWQFGTDYRLSSISGTNVQLPLTQICKSLDFSLNPNDPICVGGPRGDTPVSQLCGANSFDPSNNTCKAGSEASGRTHMYSAQAIGTNLFVPNAVGVANASWIAGPTYTGQNYGLNYIFPITESWRLESTLRYYSQKSDDGQNSTQFSPSLKLAHQWRSSVFLEGEVGINDSKTSGITTSQNKREYLYIGLRWDYR